tara:strand:+ start:159 stop:923 length:765 start_codon:yes stop_codon:yes gene_type:complete
MTKKGSKDVLQNITKSDKRRSKRIEKILIIGADSQIGSALIGHLDKQGNRVYGTSRRNKRKGLLYLDLSEKSFDIDFSFFDCVVICAGVTSVRKCEEEPELCEIVNSINIKGIVEECVNSKSFVIFLSSNAVFDGQMSFYKHNSRANPITQYGKFKLSVEEYIQRLPSNKACILRLTKVISPETTFMNNWKDEAEKGNVVEAFENRFISPISIENVLQSIDLLIKRRVSGIFQLGDNREISFFDYAKEIFSTQP